jgi:hypothetical protein
MAQKVVVTCPHCGSTGQFTIGISEGSFGFGFIRLLKRRQCHKTFRIEFRQGQNFRSDKVVLLEELFMTVGTSLCIVITKCP